MINFKNKPVTNFNVLLLADKNKILYPHFILNRTMLYFESPLFACIFKYINIIVGGQRTELRLNMIL